MVVLGQMRRQQLDRRERERAGPQVFEDDWEGRRGARRLDPMVGGVFRQVQALDAVGEERAAACGEVQLARIHFGEKRNERGGRRPFAGGHAPDFREEVAVRQLSESGRGHALNIGPPFSALDAAPGRPIADAPTADAGARLDRPARDDVASLRAGVAANRHPSSKPLPKLSRAIATISFGPTADPSSPAPKKQLGLPPVSGVSSRAAAGSSA